MTAKSVKWLDDPVLGRGVVVAGNQAGMLEDEALSTGAVVVRYDDGGQPLWASKFGSTGSTARDVVLIRHPGSGQIDEIAVVGTISNRVWLAQKDYHVYQSNAMDTIRMRPGVHVFGGFSGEGWETSLDDRKWGEQITRLLGTDADYWHNVFHVVWGADHSTLDGFHVAGGRALGGWLGQRVGAGMLNWRASPKVRNCTFYDNRAIWGGAMANLLSAPRVESCEFVNGEDSFFPNANSAFWGGGAIVNYGWRIATGKVPVIDSCTFESGFVEGVGGGICNLNSPMELYNSTFSSNTARRGGGVYTWQTVDVPTGPVIDACTFDNNQVGIPNTSDMGGVGAALFSRSGELVFFPSSRLEVTNSLFHDNRSVASAGYAIALISMTFGGQPLLVNNTIANNPNGGILWNSDGKPPGVMNSIIWNNGPPGTYLEIVPDCTAGAIVAYSDIMGGGGCDIWPENIGWDPEDDPKFAPGGFSLQFDSPCIDAAEPSYAPPKDITGAYRDPLPDMGACEFFPEDATRDRPCAPRGRGRSPRRRRRPRR